jgi:hypothetical protein
MPRISLFIMCLLLIFGLSAASCCNDHQICPYIFPLNVSDLHCPAGGTEFVCNGHKSFSCNGATGPQGLQGPMGQNATCSSCQSNVFIYRPGQVGPIPPVYSDWPTMLAAMGIVPGPKTVQVDSSIVSPAPVPAGASPWNLDGVTISGQSQFSELHFLNNSQVSAPNAIFFTDGVLITYDSTTPIYEMTSTAVLSLDLGASIFKSGSLTGSFVHVPVGVFSAIYMSLATDVGDASHSAIFVEGAVSISLVDNAVLQAHAVSGSGFLIVVLGPDGFYETPQDVASVSISLQANANRISYTPSTLAKWSGVSPATVQVALDRIAAFIGPIP